MTKTHLSSLQAQVLELREQGMTIQQIADHMGRNYSTTHETLERAKKNSELDKNPGVANALSRVGIDPKAARFGYRRVEGEDGSFDTVFWKLEEQEAATYAEELAATFSNIKPAKPTKAPKHTLKELCTLWPFTDVHAGMYAWGAETNDQDYDLDHFRADIQTAFAQLDALTPDSEQAILLLNGDTFHADDGYETPESGHKLDVDGRQHKVLDTGVQVFADLAHRMLQKHHTITIRVMRGNHDRHSHLALSLALEAYFRDEPRVTVEKPAFDLFMYQFGRCLIAAHHGDKAPAERLIMAISDNCGCWDATRHRYAFVGHLHSSYKQDYGAILFERLRAFAPPDAYSAGSMFGARRALSTLTFHETHGLVLRAQDPIERLK